MSSSVTASRSEEADSATVYQHSDSGSSQRSPVPENQGANIPNTLSTANKTVDAGDEVFDISPSTALKIFSAHLNKLVRLTGDVPPNPLMSVVSFSNEKSENAREQNGIDDTPFKVTELHCGPTKDHVGNGEAQEILQQNALARRFYSKQAPQISLEEYLTRLHRYCPMSTAVYLATSLYITRMATVEKIILVTPRNVHRLVLAGLRVAMKALEDLSYPHSRFAKVGGVSERELSRLEISFCFLIDFELRVDANTLLGEARSLRNGTAFGEDGFNIVEKSSPNGKHNESTLLAPTSPSQEAQDGAPIT
ncbi:hypothetical protein VTN00DRAFT_2500 [Thermoascus crustaceus]|uniref:uncharacterized protein n=1 Tax=Thermoascus crustaceus TaxID=5088 RepID=UPI0037440845